jgi:transposase
VLAVYAMAIKPDAASPPPEIIETLKELVAARAAAIAQGTGIANQIGASNHPLPIRLLKRRKAQIDRDVAKLEAEIQRIIAAEPALMRRRQILLSISGFGPVVTATLVAMLAELGDCNAKEIAMLAGLAPIANDSGQRQGLRSIGGGRSAPSPRRRRKKARRARQHPHQAGSPLAAVGAPYRGMSEGGDDRTKLNTPHKRIAQMTIGADWLR